MVAPCVFFSFLDTCVIFWLTDSQSLQANTAQVSQGEKPLRDFDVLLKLLKEYNGGQIKSSNTAESWMLKMWFRKVPASKDAMAIIASNYENRIENFLNFI